MTTRTTANLQRCPLAEQIEQLPSLPMRDLWALWDGHFDRRPEGRVNRFGIENRLAYAMQARAFGGLRPSVRRKLEKIGETGHVPRENNREAAQLLPGTQLARTYNGREYRVTVHGPTSFEWDGRRFKSLSAVARAITGVNWNGLRFFGLRDLPAGKTAKQGGTR